MFKKDEKSKLRNKIINLNKEKYKDSWININSQDNKGNTALHWAVYMDKKQAVDYLIYFNDISGNMIMYLLYKKPRTFSELTYIIENMLI